MTNNYKACGALAALTLLLGCTSTRLADDYQALRTEILRLEDQQIMDNLIRAKQGRPLIHLNYKMLNGKSTTRLKSSYGYSDSDQDTIAVSTTTVNTSGNNVNAEAEIAGEMSMQADLVREKAVYDRYRGFVRNRDESVEGGVYAVIELEGADLPPSNAVMTGSILDADGTLRRYYIPSQYQKEFVELVDFVMFVQKTLEPSSTHTARAYVQFGALPTSPSTNLSTDPQPLLWEIEVHPVLPLAGGAESSVKILVSDKEEAVRFVVSSANDPDRPHAATISAVLPKNTTEKRLRDALANAQHLVSYTPAEPKLSVTVE